MNSLVLGALLAITLSGPVHGAPDAPSELSAPASPAPPRPGPHDTSAAPQGDIDRAARTTLSQRYQTTLPGYEQRSAGSASARAHPSPAAPGRVRPQREVSQPPAGLGTIASWLLWTIVAVAAIAALVGLVRERGSLRSDAAIQLADEDSAGQRARAELLARPLDDAEALARATRFAEAIHVLLLRTLQELVHSVPGGLPRSLTSREIVAHVVMPAPARAALSELVRATELCHFGDTQPGEPEYRICREHFQRFAQEYVYQGQAPRSQPIRTAA